MNKLSPPLKWAGGKRWLVPMLKPVWDVNSSRRLVEPFTGGLAISLGLLPRSALLNDINIHLINFYRCLQQGLESNLSPNDNDKAVYYNSRDRFNELIKQNQHQGQESALLFYYLNRTCFNGLCRFNNSGFFNVPFGRHKQINYKTMSEFRRYIDVLEKWIFSCGDFENLDLQPDDFIYADPPYDVEFTKYAKDDFTWDDQVRLVDWLVKHSGPVIVSNQATERILNLYEDRGFKIKRLDAPRRISRTGDRTPAQEVLAYRNVEWVEDIPRKKQLQLL